MHHRGTETRRAANISEDTARSALDEVVAFLREKVPAPIFSQIET